MADKTGIEWTEATWNPIVGCTHVSPGCDNCYAAREASGRLRNLPTYAGLASGGRFTGEVRLLPDRLTQPLRWTRPRRIFVNSMSDLFHARVPAEYLARVFAVMALTRRHTYQVLTKRHGQMRAVLNAAGFECMVEREVDRLSTSPCVDLDRIGWPLPNVWLGVSVENQQWADIRIPALLDTPAAVRWISAEPLLGPVDLDQPQCDTHGREHLVKAGNGFEWCSECAADDFTGEMSYGHWLDPLNGGIQWVVVGGESGPGARPMHPQWARDLRAQCQREGVPFLFKQWGEWAPRAQADMAAARRSLWLYADGSTSSGALSDKSRPDPREAMFCVGKRAAGRELDGRLWDEYPEVALP